MKTEIKFQKIHGNGNDFVLVNDLSNDLNINKEQVQFFCNRRIGIGADGLLMIKPVSGEYDFKMLYYNADGGRVDFCGNGGRCISYAVSHILLKNKLSFIADDGPHISLVDQNTKEVYLEMKPWEKIALPDISPLLSNLKIPFKHFDAFNTGVPHVVIELAGIDQDEFKQIPVNGWGKTIRNSEFFIKEGINVNFTMNDREDNTYFQRTYERGVETETLSCGTGSVAVALYWKEKQRPEESIIKTPGGINKVKLIDNQRPVLTGIVTPVFEGSIYLEVN